MRQSATSHGYSPMVSYTRLPTPRPWQHQGNQSWASFVISLLVPTMPYLALSLFKMMDPNLLGIQGLLFSSQNVNSLNLSTFHNNSISQCKFSSKIVSVLSKSPDVAFLQDVRLKNKAHILHNFIRCTKYGNYTAITIPIWAAAA